MCDRTKATEGVSRTQSGGHWHLPTFGSLVWFGWLVGWYTCVDRTPPCDSQRLGSSPRIGPDLGALHCICYRGPPATSANGRKGGAVAMCRARQEGWSQAPNGGTGVRCESRGGWVSQETARRPPASCRVFKRKQAARRSRRGTRPPSRARCAASFPAFERQREECDQRRCTNQPTSQPTKPSYQTLTHHQTVLASSRKCSGHGPPGALRAARATMPPSHHAA